MAMNMITARHTEQPPLVPLIDAARLVSEAGSLDQQLSRRGSLFEAAIPGVRVGGPTRWPWPGFERDWLRSSLDYSVRTPGSILATYEGHTFCISLVSRVPACPDPRRTPDLDDDPSSEYLVHAFTFYPARPAEEQARYDAALLIEDAHVNFDHFPIELNPAVARELRTLFRFPDSWTVEYSSDVLFSCQQDQYPADTAATLLHEAFDFLRSLQDQYPPSYFGSLFCLAPDCLLETFTVGGEYERQEREQSSRDMADMLVASGVASGDDLKLNPRILMLHPHIRLTYTRGRVKK